MRIHALILLCLAVLAYICVVHASLEGEWTDSIQYVDSLSSEIPSDIDTAFLQMYHDAEMDSTADVEADAEIDVYSESEVEADTDVHVDVVTDAYAELDGELAASAELDDDMLLETDQPPAAAAADNTTIVDYDNIVTLPDDGTTTPAEIASYVAQFKSCNLGLIVGQCHSDGMTCLGVYDKANCGGSDTCCLPKSAAGVILPNVAKPRPNTQVQGFLAPLPFVQGVPGVGTRCGASSSGTCKQRATGCTGRFQAGLCKGAADVQCCLPALTPSPATGPGTVCPKSAAMANLAVKRGLASSLGKCAKYVGDYIQSQLPNYQRTLYARDVGPNLLKAGFKQLPVGSRLLPGDVRVIQPIPGHPIGHVQMYVGSTAAPWISDFKQRDEWPGGAWRKIASTIRHATYRYTC